MTKKKNKNSGGFVYSTNPDFDYSQDGKNPASPAEQDLRVWLERKGGNKVITIIKGYEGPEGEMKDLGKEIKASCGTGGSVKNGEILIQGDHREKVIGILVKKGFKAKAAGG